MWCGGISNRQAQSYGVAGFGFRKRTCTEMSNYLHSPFKAIHKTIICSKNSKKTALFTPLARKAPTPDRQMGIYQTACGSCAKNARPG